MMPGLESHPESVLCGIYPNLTNKRLSHICHCCSEQSDLQHRCNMKEKFPPKLYMTSFLDLSRAFTGIISLFPVQSCLFSKIVFKTAFQFDLRPMTVSLVLMITNHLTDPHPSWQIPHPPLPYLSFSLWPFRLQQWCPAGWGAEGWPISEGFSGQC